MRKLGRKKAHRNHLLRNLATSLILYERIKTTEAKAKETKALVDHYIDIAKSNNLTARRTLIAFFFDVNAVRKIVDEIAPRYPQTKGGYIKMYKYSLRAGDAAPQVILELKKADKPKLDKSDTKPVESAEKKSKSSKKEDK